MYSILDLCKKNMPARKEFEDHVYFLVSDGYSSFSHLCEADKSEVIGLLLKALDEINKWDCVVESSNHDIFIHALGEALTDPTEENKRNLFDVLQRNAISYYEDSLNEYFSEIFDEMEWDLHGDSPEFRLSRDPEYIYGTDYKR